ncbi:MAG: hypothetical protein M3299_04615, partial [Thermoproteota archaeon]|nr:hypothetical protein [Thermoproteota archaeon]
MITVITGDSILEGFDDFHLTINKKSSENSRHHSNILLDATQSIDCYLSQLSKSQWTFSNSLFEFPGTADKNKKKKIPIRVVTSINPENIDLAKELARKFSVYHTDGFGGDFCIIDGAMYFYDIEISDHKKAGYHGQLFSKNLSFVRLQQNLFENLLNHAIPARDKIK